MTGCLMVLLAGSCFGHAFWNMPLGPAPITLDRLLLVVAILQYLLYRKFGQADPKPWGAAEWLLTAFISVLALSTFTHDWQTENKRPAATFVFFYVLPFCFYWIARQMAITERGIGWAWAGLAVFGVYLSITAFAEVHQMWWLVYPRYIGSETYVEYFGRGRGPYLNPTGAGLMISAGLFALWMLWPSASGRLKAVILAITPIFAAGAYYTLTRSVWMGAALGLVIIMGLRLPRSWRWT